MTRYKKDLGQRGEIEATIFLRKKGYQILKQNYYSHWGEIDVIAVKNRTLSFVEVKTRIGSKFGMPYEAVGRYKIQKLMRPIQLFLLQNNYKDYKLSLDVISIILGNDLSLIELKHFENIYR